MHHGGLHEDAIAGKAYDARLLRRFLGYLVPYRLAVGGILLLLPLTTLCRLGQPLLLKYAIDHAITPGRLDLLAGPAALFLLLLLLEALLTWGEVYGLQMVGQRVMADLRATLFQHLLRLPVPWFDRSATGGVVTRLTSDVEALGEMFAAGIVSVIGDFLLLAGIVAAMLWMDPRLSLVTFTVLPPLIFVAWLFRRNMRQAFREVRSRLGKMNGHLAEVLGAVSVVQAFGREQEEQARFSELNAAHRDANRPVISWDASLYAIVEMFSSLAIALIIWYGSGQMLQGLLTFGTLVAFIQYIEKFFGPIRDLSAKYGIMQGAMAALERIFALLDEKQEKDADFSQISSLASSGASRRTDLYACGAPSSPPASQAEYSVFGFPLVEFRNVSFSYRPDEPALIDVNLSLQKGERLALVGESGGGKTTVIRLLSRMYELDQGQILVDGVDIRRIPREQLRRRMALVSQEPFIFAGSIAFNICLGDPRAAERVRQAAVTVGADRFIEQLPLGYETELAERGGDLSLGERQLLCFARAVAFDPELLILDEATASVDSESERLIQEGVERLLAGRTALVIAHRLSTVRDADRIVVINRGRVVEEGRHDQLLSLNGEYARLYCLQFDCGAD
ncbi:ABC transporter ATP-binding protein [Trichlorobacter lovleyi]|uniref:ABC transporter ATP-binding protein n=1 Tax=Trichlorobacter lovleyi TaxID=313985 RepID=UPI00223EF84C|nr:ABC transporter ATP-binding protein [Trichlorobacter lovleyi]QOX80049.1 ABC transporter ATP-binding protein [Trichlorobacter lovleyi]